MKQLLTHNLSIITESQMSQAAKTPVPNPIVAQLLKGLEQTEEQLYARIVGMNFGFRVSNKWSRTKTNLQDDLADSSKTKCTESNLIKLVDRVICSANHHYTIYTLESQDAVRIRSALKACILNPQASNAYSKIYPVLRDFNASPTSNIGHFLCKVVDMGDGYACIYASVSKETISGHRALGSVSLTEQSYNVVFVPHQQDRVEVRISNKAPAHRLQQFATEVNLAFIDLVLQQGISFSGDIVNFHNCIVSLYADATVGRVAHAVLTTGMKESKDAELKSFRKKDYCARTQKVEDTLNNLPYVCRAIRVRKPYTSTNKKEVEFSFVPYKNDWENNNCYFMHVVRPENTIELNNIINDALSRV